MASFAGLSMMGGRGSSLRTWSSLSFQASLSPARPLSLPQLFQQPTQLCRAPHFTCVRFALTEARPLSSSVVQKSESEERLGAEDNISTAAPKVPHRPVNRKFPALSPKEKKELRAYAHSLGKKIVSQQIGKAGVTEALAKAMSDALEAKEILKLKVLDNCPDEIEVVIAKIEAATQAQVVGKIGSVITLYRPSLRKLSEAGRSQNKEQEGYPRRTAGRPWRVPKLMER